MPTHTDLEGIDIARGWYANESTRTYEPFLPRAGTVGTLTRTIGPHSANLVMSFGVRTPQQDQTFPLCVLPLTSDGKRVYKQCLELGERYGVADGVYSSMLALLSAISAVVTAGGEEMNAVSTLTELQLFEPAPMPIVSFNLIPACAHTTLERTIQVGVRDCFRTVRPCHVVQVAAFAAPCVRATLSPDSMFVDLEFVPGAGIHTFMTPRVQLLIYPESIVRVRIDTESRLCVATHKQLTDADKARAADLDTHTPAVLGKRDKSEK
jgi:hypothetical protein